MTQLQGFNLVDPFQGNCILSLHPRTLRDSKISLKSNDLEAIHQHMNSMALQNPDKHFEEAKSIIDGCSKLLNTKENEANMKENENSQRNRPALARKRAKFSLKPDISQPATILEPVFQFDQLQDPEEFFAAYEKFEKTVKELKRQRGEDLNEAKIPSTARQRRPEIPRRKISYQHHVYSSQSQSDISFSQETLQNTTEIPPIHVAQQESVTPNCKSNEKEITESTSKAEDKEDKVNKLFHDLMSSNIANLDENDALSYLKDQLKIKPVDINSLQLPNLHNIPKIDLISSVKNFTKDQSILTDTCELSDSLEEITLRKQNELPDQHSNTVSSPTPPRKPFSAISTFEKFSPESTETHSNDPFSAHEIDLIPTTTTSEIISVHSIHASKDKEFSVSASEDKEFPVSDNISEPAITMVDLEQEHDLEEMDAVTDIQKNEDIQENIEDATPEDNVDITTTEELKSNCFQSGGNMGGADGFTLGQPAQTVDNSVNVLGASPPVQNPPEQQNKEHPKKSMNNTKKIRASKVDLKKKRHSLAEAGSSWTTGVRRSNRIKRKPLEYWKGERLLYGRVHNSLPTIIGVKYLSPTNQHGKHGFKVESFIPDKYKDLVELISLH